MGDLFQLTGFQCNVRFKSPAVRPTRVGADTDAEGNMAKPVVMKLKAQIALNRFPDSASIPALPILCRLCKQLDNPLRIRVCKYTAGRKNDRKRQWLHGSSLRRLLQIQLPHLSSLISIASLSCVSNRRGPLVGRPAALRDAACAGWHQAYEARSLSRLEHRGPIPTYTQRPSLGR